PFRGLVRDHLGVDPSDLPVVAQDVPNWDHANLQLGLDALAEREDRSAELIGIAGGQKRFMALSLSDLLNEGHFRPGPVEYENIDVGPKQTHSCMLFGLVLLRDAEGPSVLLVRRAEQHGPVSGLQVEVMAPDDGRAAALLAELRELMRERNVFRGP